MRVSIGRLGGSSRTRSKARTGGFHLVRIVHGRGIGVQRETVRAILARTDFVAGFRDAPPEAGGWGATIVTLR
ncbi:MAG: Smr/MutS family protein [Bryobacteraceae bacterium]